MKVLILSDLHLGSPLFSVTDQVIKLLGSTDYNVVILLGDLIDVWEDDLQSILEDNPELYNAIVNHPNIIIVKGNHDPSIKRLSEIFPNKTIVDSYEINDMLFFHGHEFDKIIGKYPIWTCLLGNIHWLLQRVGINSKAWLRKFTYTISAKKQDTSYELLVTEFEQLIVEKYIDSKYSAVVMGHSHFPKKNVYEKEDSTTLTYLNVGDGISSHTYGVIEVSDETSKYTIKNYKK